METRKLTRRELYDLVWSMPMTKLAPRFGMSDVALRKRCHGHEIPTPGAGYWAQIAAGQEPEKADLLPAAPELEDIIFEPETTSALQKPPVPVVDVAEELRDPHPVVTWLDRRLNKAKAERHGRLVVGPDWSPEAVLSESVRNRALRVLDAVVKVLELRGHKVEARMRGQHATCEEIVIDAFEEELSLQLEEKLARKPHVLTAEERADKERWEKRGWGGTWNGTVKYDYYTDGEIKISIGHTHYKYNGRKSCSDTKTQRLDDQLGHLVVAIEAAARLGRNERLEIERLERERRDAERKRLRAERLRWYGRKLAEEVEHMAADWKKAGELRDFLAAYDRALPAGKRDRTAETWFKAVKNYADRLDPLAKPEKLAKELEPSDEVLEQLIAADKERERQ